MLRIAIVGLLACLMAACGPADRPEDGRWDDADPLLWEIASADGEVEGWLLGTIHALPDGVEWRTPAVDAAIAQADVLAVEIAAVGDGHAMRDAFVPLAFSPGQPPLEERVPLAERAALAELVDDTTYRMDDFGGIESWGAALILAQAVESAAKSSNGIDRALVRDFAGREVTELEGARRQFAVFDRLSEDAQRAMLVGIVEETRAPPEDRERPIRVFLAGDEAALDALTREGIMSNPEIREALLSARNRDWTGRIDRLLARAPKPLIAVGAAHMVGEDGLVAMLRAEGYRVSRVAR